MSFSPRALASWMSQILSGEPLGLGRVATRPNPKGSPDKIWLIQDANALGEKDIQILLKLIENFPGAGICAVLMFDSSQTEVLSVFENNSKINTWVLSLPTAVGKLKTQVLIFELFSKTESTSV